MQLKVAVSVFLVVAVAASLFFFWGDPLLMGFGATAGLSVLGYWMYLARTYRKLLLESLMGDNPAAAEPPEPQADGDVDDRR